MGEEGSGLVDQMKYLSKRLNISLNEISKIHHFQMLCYAVIIAWGGRVSKCKGKECSEHVHIIFFYCGIEITYSTCPNSQLRKSITELHPFQTMTPTRLIKIYARSLAIIYIFNFLNLIFFI